MLFNCVYLPAKWHVDDNTTYIMYMHCTVEKYILHIRMVIES